MLGSILRGIRDKNFAIDHVHAMGSVARRQTWIRERASRQRRGLEVLVEHIHGARAEISRQQKITFVVAHQRQPFVHRARARVVDHDRRISNSVPAGHDAIFRVEQKRVVHKVRARVGHVSGRRHDDTLEDLRHVVHISGRTTGTAGRSRGGGNSDHQRLLVTCSIV